MNDRKNAAQAEREAQEAEEREAALKMFDDQAIDNQTAKECQCCFGEGAEQNMGTPSCRRSTLSETFADQSGDYSSEMLGRAYLLPRVHKQLRRQPSRRAPV